MVDKTVVSDENSISWQQHPELKSIQRKPLLTKRDHGADLTVVLVKGAKGITVPEHIHQGCDDIIYVMDGKFKIFIEGTGEVQATKGMLICVPRDAKHHIYDVEEEYQVFDVFIPPTL